MHTKKLSTMQIQISTVLQWCVGNVLNVCVVLTIKGRARLKTALAEVYYPLYERQLDVEHEVAVTSGATAGLLAAMMAFLEPGDEVVVMEPVFSL